MDVFFHPNSTRTYHEIAILSSNCSVRGYISIDIDVSELQVNQCNSRRSAVAASSRHPSSDAALGPPTTSAHPTLTPSSPSMMIIAEFQSMRAAAAISREAHAIAAAAAAAVALAAGGDAAALAAVATGAADPISSSLGAVFSAAFNEVEAFHGSHKCHAESMQVDAQTDRTHFSSLSAYPREMQTHASL